MTTVTTAVAELTCEPAEQSGYELGRYTVREEERVLRGRRVNDEAILVDFPVGSDGRIYLVERGVEQDGYAALQALVLDYIDTAQALGRIPMASDAPPHQPERGA